MCYVEAESTRCRVEIIHNRMLLNDIQARDSILQIDSSTFEDTRDNECDVKDTVFLDINHHRCSPVVD